MADDFQIPGALTIVGLTTHPSAPDRYSRFLPNVAGSATAVADAPLLPRAELPTYNDPMRRVDRSPLIDILPQFTTIEAGWDGALPYFPDPFNIAAGESAWFGLQRIRIPQDSAQEIMLYGIDVDLCPPDVDGAGGVDQVAWGNTRGTGAAIVIGENLPIKLGDWRNAPAFVPRVETTGQGALVSTKFARQVKTINFPSGKYTDTTPQRKVLSWNFAPGGWRFPYNSTLDVALVVRSTQAQGNGARRLFGSGLVSLTVFRTNSRADFSQ